jgi:predicted nuclease of predicted toxin-antitoxin system
MKFLVNENFPLPSISLLRNAGFEVLSVSEMNPGISDHEVIRQAISSNGIILTFDKDYGELIFKHAFQNPPPVVFFRFKGETPEYAGPLLVNLIKEEKISLDKIFTVIEKENIRQRKY